LPSRTLAISANTGWYIANFAQGLIRGLSDAGYRPVIVAPEDRPGDAAACGAELGVEWVVLKIDRAGLNPLADLRLLREYRSILKRLRPLAYLGFTIKPNLYGSLAARSLGIPAIANINGLGTAFIRGGALERLVTGLYRAALRHRQAVFFHNQYTSQTAAFAPLANSGYVTTDGSSNVFGLFDANNANIGWLSLPSDAPGTPTVNALDSGGFVFTYAGTSHFDLYDASGGLLAHGDLSATGSQFATGFASLAGNGDGFLQAWLSPDGSTYNGVATSLDIQAMGPAGAITPVMTLTQDLDPWHTQFKLQAHADGSVGILWSEGGAVFGAEYANGALGPVQSAGVLGGDLAHTVAVELPGDKEGFAWDQNGHAWAEIFDPATGEVLRADLGTASNDDIHAVATAQGGLAVSWHQNAYTGAVLDASGQVGALTSLYGQFLGVDAAGEAVTLHENGVGTPVLQTYTLNDGAFWVH